MSDFNPPHDLRSPFEQGMDARKAGRTIHDNPYVTHGGLGSWISEWEDGWEAEDKNER